MGIIVSLLIGGVIGYGIGRFVEARKNAKEKKELMLQIGNTVENARSRANRRWNR